MSAESIITEIKEKFGSKIKRLDLKSARRVYIDIEPGDIVEAVRSLYQDMHARFSIATGTDTVKGIEILYHFSFDARGGVFVSLRVLLEDKKKPCIASLTSLLKAADWIEREIHELLGVDFIGHPKLAHLLLVEDWPEGKYPLRKDFISEKGLPENE